jgi:hypothetical protein
MAVLEVAFSGAGSGAEEEGEVAERGGSEKGWWGRHCEDFDAPGWNSGTW